MEGNWAHDDETNSVGRVCTFSRNSAQLLCDLPLVGVGVDVVAVARKTSRKPPNPLELRWKRVSCWS